MPTGRRTLKRFIPALVATAIVGLNMPVSEAATLSSASLKLSDSRPSATSVTYDLQASGVSLSAIKCIKIEFDSAATGAGGKPTGLNVSSADLDDAATDYVPTPASWSVANDNTAGTVSITLAGGETPASASGRNVVLTGITNGSTASDDFFALVSTYDNTDCSSSGVDSVTVAFIYADGQSVSMSVDPTLSFSVAGKASGTTCNSATTNVASTSSTVPFGRPTASTNAIAAQDLSVATNAGSGYTVYTRYTQALTSGSNTIADHSGSNASPASSFAAGTAAFGYTTDDATLGTGTADRFTSGGPKWSKFTTSNGSNEVAYSASAASSDTTCVGYQVGISSTTPPGTYQSTVIFTATPVF